MTSRTETIARGDCPPACELAPGVELRVFASGQSGARGLTTGTATFRAGAALPYHTHPESEVIVVLSGEAQVVVEGRCYLLRPYDAVHVPAQMVHRVANPSAADRAVLFSSFASETVTREPAACQFDIVDRQASDGGCPENLIRFETAPVYELSARAYFRDLFARRLGSLGICGGYGIFQPGASLPCHIHGFDESITIVTGRAVCQVAGKEYALADC